MRYDDGDVRNHTNIAKENFETGNERICDQNSKNCNEVTMNGIFPSNSCKNIFILVLRITIFLCYNICFLSMFPFTYRLHIILYIFDHMLLQHHHLL